VEKSLHINSFLVLVNLVEGRKHLSRIFEIRLELQCTEFAIVFELIKLHKGANVVQIKLSVEVIVQSWLETREAPGSDLDIMAFYIVSEHLKAREVILSQALGEESLEMGVFDQLKLELIIKEAFKLGVGFFKVTG
jgi:hypothetical protein